MSNFKEELVEAGLLDRINAAIERGVDAIYTLAETGVPKEKAKELVLYAFDQLLHDDSPASEQKVEQTLKDSIEPYASFTHLEKTENSTIN